MHYEGALINPCRREMAPKDQAVGWHQQDCEQRVRRMRSTTCAVGFLDSEMCLCRLGVVADVGQTYNSSVTYQHLVADNPDVSALVLSSACD